ncbi:MAG: glycosyltransferase family 4 protein [Ginsengibacter sp.]
MKNKIRIAIVSSHPIQHLCPQYVSFSHYDQVKCKVFFGSALGLRKYMDQNFGQEIYWNNLNLDRFNHHFLNGDKIIQPDKNLDADTLEKELENYHPDMVFTYGYFQKLQRRTYRWAIRNDVPLVYISDSELRHRTNRFKQFVMSLYLRRYFSPISYFLTMGDANEEYYRKHSVSASKMIRMHYPIDFNTYKRAYQEKENLRRITRNKYGISENEIVLSVVGKLVPWKNQDHIIDAMTLLEEEGILVHLFILGSGEMKDVWELKAKQLKKSKVYFTGFVNSDQLPSYYAATDVYVHPASLEPHSVAISEALIMGCPIVLSDRCGSYGKTDDVQVGKDGYVFEFGNTKDLAEKIRLLITDQAKRESFGKYAHELGMQFQENSHSGFLEKLLDRFRIDKNK